MEKIFQFLISLAFFTVTRNKTRSMGNTKHLQHRRVLQGQTKLSYKGTIFDFWNRNKIIVSVSNNIIYYNRKPIQPF